MGHYMARTKREKEVILCGLCGEEIIGEPYKMDMQNISGRAKYHFQFSDKMFVCGECSGSFIEACNVWFSKRNKTNTYAKFPIDK